MSRVLHLLSHDPDLQTDRSARTLSGAKLTGCKITTRTIDPGGEYSNTFWAALRLRRDADEFDVIHAWDDAALAAALPARQTRVIFTLPDGFLRAPTSWLFAAALRRGVCFVATTPAQQALAIARGIPESRCTLVRPPIDVETPEVGTRVAIRQQLEIADDDFIMLAAGESNRAADHERAVWVGSILHVVDEHHRVLLWGRGPRINIAAGLGRKLRQPHLVVRSDPTTPYDSLLAAADALLVTAHAATPTLPVALAMAAGLPILAVARPELSELLIDDETAFTIPSNAPRLLAQRVMDLRSNAETVQRITTNAKQHVRDKFEPGRFVQEMTAVYQRMEVPHAPRESKIAVAT